MTAGALFSRAPRRLWVRWLLFLLVLGAVIFVALYAFRAKGASYTWDGGGTTNNWSDCVNWTTDTCPTSADTVTFDATSVKDAVVDASFAGTVSSMYIASGYTGTVSLARSLTASASTTIASGTFALVTNSYHLSNGIFTQTGGTVMLGGGSATFTSSFILGAGTFDTATSSVSFNYAGLGTANISIPSSLTFYDLTMSPGLTGSTLAMGTGDTFVVTHTLTFGGVGLINTGTIDVQGATVSTSDTNSQGGGSATTHFGQNGDESIACATAGNVPGLWVDKPSGTLTISHTCPTFGTSSSTISSAAFTIGTSSFTANNNFTQTGGTFSLGGGAAEFKSNFTLAAGTFDTATSTVMYWAGNLATPVVNVPTSQTYYDLAMNAAGTGSNLTISSGDTLVATHALSFDGVSSGGFSGGTIDVQGAVVTAGTNKGGSTVVNFGQSGDETIQCTTSGSMPSITVAKPSGTLTFNCATLNAGGGTNTLSSGTIYVGAGKTFEMGLINTNSGAYSQSGGIFSLGGGTLSSVGNFTITSGTFDAATGTVIVNAGNSQTSVVNVPTSQTFYNLTLNPAGSGTSQVNISAGDTLVVSNTLSVTGASTASVNGSIALLQAEGNVSVALNSITVPMTFSGSAAQTLDLTGHTGGINGTTTINKTGGSVQLLSDFVLDASKQNLEITQGTFDLNGHNVTVSGSGGALDLYAGGNLLLQGGESLPYPSINLGTTTYNGSGSYTSLVAGPAYDNLVFSGSGSWATSSDIFLLDNFSQSAGTASLSGTTYISSTSVMSTSAGTSLGSVSIGASSFSGLSAYWTFDEGSGSSASDASGNGATASLQASPTWVSGQYGSAISLNGTSQYALIYNGAVASTPAALKTFANGDHSFTAWIKTTQTSGTAPFTWTCGALIIEGRSYADDPPYGWAFGATSNHLCVAGSSLSGQTFSGTATINDGSWHFVAATVRGTAVTLYVDGQLDKTATFTIGTNHSIGQTSNSTEIGIGVRGTDAGLQNTNFFGGTIDDLQLYSRALSASEVAGLYVATAGHAVSLAGSGLSLSGNLTIATSSSLDASTAGCSGASCNISLTGNWVNWGTFTPRTGTVTFAGGSQSITGSSTFYNLVKTVLTAATWTFSAGSTQTVGGTWTAQGASGNKLSLRSSSPGTQWKIDPQGTRTISYLDVQDSNNINATIISAAGTNSTDSLNNTNWDFTGGGGGGTVSRVVRLLGNVRFLGGVRLY